MKIRNDNPCIRKIKEKNDYTNPSKQKQLYNDASDMFQYFARQEAIRMTDNKTHSKNYSV